MPRAGIPAAAAGVAIVVVAAACMRSDLGPSGDADPDRPTAPSSAAATAQASDAATLGDRLGEIAWWDTQGFAFGTTGMEPQPRPATPGPYRQLRVGTLDGRVTAVRTLPDGWSRSYVSGPVGGEVLVVADAGDATALSTITAATGAQELLFETQFIVPAATLSPEGDEIWYVKIDRTSGGDLGLWRRPRAGEVETQVLREPLGEPFDPTGLSVWQVMISPDGEHVAAQWCFGEVRCATHVVHVASGRVQSTDDLGWARGFTESQLVTAGVEADHQGVRAVDLSTFQETAWFRAGFEDGVTVNADGGWWLVGSLGAGAPTRLLRLLPGAEPVEVPGPENDFTTFHRPYDAGVGPLPGGWVLRYPEVIGTWPGEGQFASGQLINISTGERLELQPFLPEITADECPIVAPSQTPAGLASGSSRSELRDGVRYVRWSQGPDAVTLAMGALGLSADEPVVAETTVRGNPATVAVLGEPGVDEVAIVWEEDGCTYTALLAPGTTVESAIEYAGRY